MKGEDNEHRELGVVKWFGGFNSKTNRENDYGFIASIRGDDVFVHKSDLIETTTLLEGDEVTFLVTQDSRGPQAKDIQYFSLGNEEVVDFVNVLKRARVDGGSNRAEYLSYLKELEQFFYSSPDDIKSKIAEALFEDDAGRSLINGFRNKTGIYRQVLLAKDFTDFIAQGPDLEELPHELIRENEEAVCRVICEGGVASVSREFLESATLPILNACGLVNLIDEQTAQARQSELRVYLREKFVYPNGRKARLYKDIFAACLERIGGYTASPVIWGILSELLLKKYFYDRNFDKAAQLFNSNSGLEHKIDFFILHNLAQLLASGNDLRTTYQIFVHLLWQALASEQIDVGGQVERILLLFPNCGTIKLAMATEPTAEPYPEEDDDDPFEGLFGSGSATSSKKGINSILRAPVHDRNLSCEAVYWEKQNKFLCRGSVCSNPQIRPDLKKSYLDFSIYDWLTYFGVEFWGSEDHQVRDFPVKLAGYLNRLREIMPRLRCRSCAELMVPDFKYSRVKCWVYEHGRLVQRDMAAAYRNTVFHCNNDSCQELNARYYINHCLGYLCFDLIDSRDLKTKCDYGRLICKGCASCCGEHAKSNPIGFCPECGANLLLFENRSQVSKFGRHPRYVQCSKMSCGFGKSEPGLSKKFYLESCKPVHLVEGGV